MSNNSGLLHLIFSTPSSQLNENSPLTPLFEKGMQLSFKDTRFKEKLLRNPNREETNLLLYNSRNGNLPGLELAHCESSHQLTSESYGLLFPEINIPQQDIKKAMGHPVLSEIFGFHKSYVDYDLNSFVSLVPDLTSFGCTAGAWLTSHNTEKICDFFKNAYNAKVIHQENSFALIKSKVINRKFSDFMWVIIQEQKPLEEKFFIDDPGLVTLGWLTSDLKGTIDIVKDLGYSVTEVFEICTGQRVFDICFCYGFDIPVNEFIQLKKIVR